MINLLVASCKLVNFKNNLRITIDQGQRMKVILFYDSDKAKKERLWEWCWNIGIRNRGFQPLRNENHILR